MKKRRTIVKSSPTGMTSEEDMRRLPADWNRVPARTKTQVSAKQPAYRYQGELFVAGEMPERMLAEC